MLYIDASIAVCCGTLRLHVAIVTADLKLLLSAGSDRAWVWNTKADFADEEAKPEQLTIDLPMLRVSDFIM